MFFARKKRDAALRDTIDRLGAVRDALRVLRVREEALLEELETYRPGSYARGDAYEMETRMKSVRSFAQSALPKSILNDESFWRVETRKVLTFVPLDSTQKTPTAEQIADTYAETHDLPIGLPQEEANYGADPGFAPASPQAAPLRREDLAPSPVTEDETFDSLEKALAMAEPGKAFDFAGVPRYRTGGKPRKDR